MVLVVFLLAYVIRQRLDRLGLLSSDDLWRSWLHRGARSKAGKEGSLLMGVALVLVPAVALAALVLAAGYGGIRILVYPVELIVLVLMMGVPGWRPALEAYTESWGRGDMQGAWHHIEGHLPEEQRGSAQSAEVMHLLVSRALVVSVFERFFLVVFWYVVGGIWLAVIARGLVALAEQWPQPSARQRFAVAAGVMGWLPSRLLACTFGVAGDLAGWSRSIRSVVPGFGKPADTVLMTAASGSLTGYALDPERFARVYADDWSKFGGRSVRAMRDLLSRSMLVWICATALLVIAGVL
jgi:AmpE protein